LCDWGLACRTCANDLECAGEGGFEPPHSKSLARILRAMADDEPVFPGAE